METKISQYLIKEVKKMVRASRQDVKAVLLSEDEEAVHNFRVSIRRLRSFLLTIKGLYYKGYMRPIQNSLKQLANSTNELRDLEVTLQKLRKLKIPEQHSTDLNQWIMGMQKREEELRLQLKEQLNHSSVLEVLTHLEALIQLPVPPEKDITAKEYAFQLCAALRQEWLDRRRLMPHYSEDSEWLHNFRILSKKVRYNFTFYQKILPPVFQSTATEARSIQNLLGEINDYYVMEKRLLTTSLDKNLKDLLLLLLIAKRDRFRKKIKKLRPKP